MQRHGGLAGPGAPLDEEQPGERGPDDLVLLALDGGDDVAHLAGTGPADSRQEGAGAAELDAPVERAGAGPDLARPLDPATGAGAVGDVEVLVLQPDHPLPVHRQVAPSRKALGGQPGRPVEGLGHRRPPVDDQWLVGGVGHGQAPDVEGLGLLPVALGGHVDTAEAERLVTDVELGQAGKAGPHDDVALGARLEGPAPAEI